MIEAKKIVLEQVKSQKVIERLINDILCPA